MKRAAPLDAELSGHPNTALRQACEQLCRMLRIQWCEFVYSCGSEKWKVRMSEDRNQQSLGLRGAAIIGAAIGALAVGAFAIGALAIRRLAIQRVAVERAKFKSLEIEELTVKHLRAGDVTVSGSIELPKG